MDVCVATKADPRETDQVIDGISFCFTRRRYGSREYGKTTTYTWVSFWNGGDWHLCGDPFPSIRVPKAELEKIAAQIKLELPTEISSFLREN